MPRKSVASCSCQTPVVERRGGRGIGAVGETAVGVAVLVCRGASAADGPGKRMLVLGVGNVGVVAGVGEAVAKDDDLGERGQAGGGGVRVDQRLVRAGGETAGGGGGRDAIGVGRRQGGNVSGTERRLDGVDGQSKDREDTTGFRHAWRRVYTVGVGKFKPALTPDGLRKRTEHDVSVHEAMLPMPKSTAQRADDPKPQLFPETQGRVKLVETTKLNCMARNPWRRASTRQCSPMSLPTPIPRAVGETIKAALATWEPSAGWLGGGYRCRPPARRPRPGRCGYQARTSRPKPRHETSADRKRKCPPVRRLPKCISQMPSAS